MNASHCCVIHTLPVLFLVLLMYFHQENYSGHVACMKEKISVIIVLKACLEVR